MWGVESDPRPAPPPSVCSPGISSASYTQGGHSFPKWLTLHAHLSASGSSLSCHSCLTPPTQLLCCCRPRPFPLWNPPRGMAVMSLVPFPWWLSWAFLLFSHHYVYPGGGRGGLSAGCPPYSALPSAPQPLNSQGSAMQPSWEALGSPHQQSTLLYRFSLQILTPFSPGGNGEV